jgi:hypothetical protein
MAGVAHGSIKVPGLDRETAKHFVEETPKKKRSAYAKLGRRSKY